MGGMGGGMMMGDCIPFDDSKVAPYLDANGKLPPLP
jgi:hypothetical protein